ncbi:MAG: glutamate--cysteine ligase [Candidatus Endobugula sp.]
MSDLLNNLHAIAAQTNYAGIHHLTRGIEKESLRITPNGTLSMTPHPEALGSALTHPHITTDYSEALLEFITAPCTNSKDSLQQLRELHAYTYQHIGDERLWVTSMPCMLGEDKHIPIAQFGNSNSGTMKSAYRMGLGHRYGRSMQTIAGIHYNFSVADSLWQQLMAQEKSPLSLKDFKTQGYFRLIRNFRRYYWLLLYLFGASPGVCKSFIRNQEHRLIPFAGNGHSLHTPFATSLRMGDLGYQSNAQDSLVITYNCLDSYIKTLCCAITQTHPEYAAFGIKDNLGNYQQLNDSLLQIENEFYSVIRPKRTVKRGQTALSALADGGIEYIEVRCLDLNPYDAIGINEQQMHFMDTFLLYCLLSDSPASDNKENNDIQENQTRMVYDGRDPTLTLKHNGQERPMREWGQELMQSLESVAKVLDQANGARPQQQGIHQQSVVKERGKLTDASLTPSARVLADMAEQQITFYRFAANMSQQHQAYFNDYPLGEQLAHYQTLASESLAQQQLMDKSDTMNFANYLADYYSQYQCTKSSELAGAE